MSFADDLLNKLFPGKNTPAATVPVREQLIRSEVFLADFEQALPETIEHLNTIARAYHLKRAGIEARPLLDVLSSPAANGLRIRAGEDSTSQSFSFLLDLLMRNVLATGLYVRHNADRSSRAGADSVQVIDRYYLKPRRNRQPGVKQPQYYGNLLMELTSTNEQPMHLKIMATTYSDAGFTAPLPFDELLTVLFQD